MIHGITKIIKLDSVYTYGAEAPQGNALGYEAQGEQYKNLCGMIFRACISD